VHETPFPRQVLKDVILFYKLGLEGTLGYPIGLVLIGCGIFPGEDYWNIETEGGESLLPFSNNQQLLFIILLITTMNQQ
jgi:hypothetical protein